MRSTAKREASWCGSGPSFGLLAVALFAGGCEAPRPAVTEVHLAAAPPAEATAGPSAEGSAASPDTDEPGPAAPRKKSRAPSVPVVDNPAPSASPTDIDRAKELFKLASAAYAAGDYTNAKANFEAAYAIVPERALLFNIASVELKLGQTSASCAHFRKYVASGDPSDARVQEVSQQVAQRCP
jgi:hypothetical protein